ncbi:MAG: hypothetical protein ACYCZS_12870 [Thiobacillus sp.]
MTAGQLDGLAKPVLQQRSIGQIGENIVVDQMLQLNFSGLDLFGQFVRFNAGGDEVCAGLLQHQDVIVGRYLRRTLAKMGSIFAQVDGIFPCSGRFLTAQDSRFIVNDGAFSARDIFFEDICHPAFHRLVVLAKC